MELHFHVDRGYMNDPNGLVYYNGLYHAFYQSSFGRMDPLEKPVGWGHAVSEDMVHWRQIEDALQAEYPYERNAEDRSKTGHGCYSGSAVEKDGRLYLFYTSAARPCASVSVAWSDDGIHFTKNPENPVILRGPLDGDDWHFRDPKVQKIGDTYHMVLGNSGPNGGRIVRYTSKDLLHWTYAGVLYENGTLGAMLECPDFFPLGDKYVILASVETRSVVLVVGDFDGETFTPERICTPEQGCSFYAAQTFQGPDGRRMMLAWAFETDLRPRSQHIGCLTVLRELKLVDGEVHSVPIQELEPYLTDTDPCVRITENSVALLRPDGRDFGYPCTFLHARAVQFEGEKPLRYDGPVEDVKILHDGDIMEVFINHGKCNFVAYICR